MGRLRLWVFVSVLVSTGCDTIQGGAIDAILGDSSMVDVITGLLKLLLYAV